MCFESSFFSDACSSRIPVAYPEGKDGNVSIKVISGKSHGVESPVRPLGGCWYFHVLMNNGATMFQDIRVYYFTLHLKFVDTVDSCRLDSIRL